MNDEKKIESDLEKYKLQLTNSIMYLFRNPFEKLNNANSVIDESMKSLQQLIQSIRRQNNQKLKKENFQNSQNSGLNKDKNFEKRNTLISGGDKNVKIKLNSISKEKNKSSNKIDDESIYLNIIQRLSCGQFQKAHKLMEVYEKTKKYQKDVDIIMDKIKQKINKISKIYKQNLKTTPISVKNLFQQVEFLIQKINKQNNFLKQNQKPEKQIHKKFISFIEKMAKKLTGKSDMEINLQKSDYFMDKFFEDFDSLKAQEVSQYLFKSKKLNQINSILKNSVQDLESGIDTICKLLKNQNINQNSVSTQTIIYEQQQQQSKIKQKIIQNKQLLIQNENLKKNYKNLQKQLKQEVLRIHDTFLKQLFSSSNILNQNCNQEKQLLIDWIYKECYKQIKTFRFIYRYDDKNTQNIHTYIDKIPYLLLLIKLKNGLMLGGFTSQAIHPSASCKSGFIFSLNKAEKFPLKAGHYVTYYDPYYIIFGNAQIRIKVRQNLLFSNFGIINSCFDHKNKKINYFLEQGQHCQVEIQSYELYQAIIDD